MAFYGYNYCFADEGLNFELNLGSVLYGSGLNHGSELNLGITTQNQLKLTKFWPCHGPQVEVTK